MCDKEGIVLKPVGQTRIRDRWLTVWSLMTSGQVLAGWLLSAVSRKQSVEMTQSRVTNLHASLW